MFRNLIGRIKYELGRDPVARSSDDMNTLYALAKQYLDKKIKEAKVPRKLSIPDSAYDNEHPSNWEAKYSSRRDVLKVLRFVRNFEKEIARTEPWSLRDSLQTALNLKIGLAWANFRPWSSIGDCMNYVTESQKYERAQRRLAKMPALDKYRT